MAPRKSADPRLHTSAASVFGAVIRRAREGKGLSQGDLAKLIPCGRPLVTRVESGTRVPQLSYVRACDEILGTGGELMELWAEIDWHVPVEHPDWFQRYVRLEAEATLVQEFHPTWMSGLLQTEAFARALFSEGDAASNPDLIEERVAARLDRQTRFLAEDGPFLVVLLSEASLRQMVGGVDVMRDQLRHVLNIGQRRNIVIQVVPFSLGARLPFDNMVTLLTAPDGSRRIYSESLGRGRFIEDPQEIQRRQRAYDRLRADALSVRESAQVIQGVMKGLVNMSTTPPGLSAAPWRKSTYSSAEGGNCIEVADGFPGVVPVRDSKDPDGPALVFPADSWSAFVAGVRAGDFPAPR